MQLISGLQLTTHILGTKYFSNFFFQSKMSTLPGSWLLKFLAQRCFHLWLHSLSYLCRT